MKLGPLSLLVTVGCSYPPLPDPDAITGPAAMWSTPVPISGLSTGLEEDNPSCTPDRLTIVFTSHRNGSSDLFLGVRGSPLQPFSVSPLSALNDPSASETSPEITPDGNTIYFVSDRIMASGTDVYVAHKTGSTWATATVDPVPSLSSFDDDHDIAISPDQLTAVIVRSGQFWLAHRPSLGAEFEPPTRVPSLDLPGKDPAAPSITNDGNAIYFHAGESSSTRDLYYARLGFVQYTTPLPIVTLNTSGRDAAPFVTGDERYLIFSRADDLYEAMR